MGEDAVGIDARGRLRRVDLKPRRLSMIDPPAKDDPWRELGAAATWKPGKLAHFFRCGKEPDGIVVSEGAGERSIREELLYGWRAALALPASAVQTTALAVLSQTLPPPSLVDSSAKISPRAVFFIYAQHGVGSEELNRTFYAHARRPKEIWEVDGSRHVGGLEAQPAAYESRILIFLELVLEFLDFKVNIIDRRHRFSPPPIGIGQVPVALRRRIGGAPKFGWGL